jgi:plastocyanin
MVLFAMLVAVPGFVLGCGGGAGAIQARAAPGLPYPARLSTKPGRSPYICTIHQYMMGTLIVK